LELTLETGDSAFVQFDGDINQGVEGKMFSELGFVNEIKVPESAKDYFTFGMNSTGGVKLGAGISPPISDSLLQYKVVGIKGEMGVNAQSNHDMDGNADIGSGNIGATYKASVSPYLYIDFTLIGVEGTNRIDILKDKDYEYEVSYSSL
jgi:hypothetical protein